MDVNGTRFHLLLGKDDWATCTDGQTSLGQAWDPSFPNGNTTGFDWDDDRNELTLQSRLFQFVAAPQDRPPTLDDRRGAGRDRYGNWYWIDETRREIRVNSVGTGVTSHFWSVGDGVECTTGDLATSTRPGAFQPREPKPAPAPLQLSGLAVTDEHYLVVGVVEPAGLLIFDLYAVGSPQQVLWPKTVPFTPFDMAPAPCGGVWILDRDYKRFWRLNRQFNVLKPDQAVTPPATTPTSIFQPTDGSAPQKSAVCIPTHAISLDASSPLAVENPIAIEGLPDDTILILESKPGDAFSHIYRYHYSKLLGKPVSTQVMGELIEKNTAGQPKPFRLLGYDFAFVPERKRTDGTVGAPDQLYIAADNGNQAFAFLLSQQNDFLDMRPLPDYFPMRHFGGKGLVTAYGQVYYDFGNVWLPLIAQPRRRYVPEAVLYTRIDLSDQDVSSPPMSKPRHALDGRTPDCAWHRLMLDACIPPGAQVRVWSRAANDERDLPITAWRQEPPFYLRGDGSELPFVGKSSIEGNGTWELLFQHAQGRYLQLKLILSGNERVTPHLQALRIYYPRFSYLEHYLPAVYREDRGSASFLDRFLANFEGFYTPLEDKIVAIRMLFDARSAPAETLDWLASWFGIALDPAWDERKRRVFIKHAMDFFQYRGTICGLKMALRLTFEDCPDGPDETIFTDCASKHPRANSIRIVEKYLTRSTPGVVFGDPTDLIGPRLVSPTKRWQPIQGRAELLRRYNEVLHLSGQEPFPIRDPGGQNSAVWRQFSQNVLGFVPSAGVANLQQWQNFLSRRYQSVAAFNLAYGLSASQQIGAFTDVPLPGQLPQDGAPLLDWYQFESVVLAVYRTAHRFTVLLPTPKALDTEEHQRRVNLAQRIVDLEKPAHTVFDVKFYWAYFRVGEARLGEDTLIDRGSRAPQLLSPMVLGQAYLAESYLAPTYPQDIANRQVLGRERLNG